MVLRTGSDPALAAILIVPVLRQQGGVLIQLALNMCVSSVSLQATGQKVMPAA